MSVKQVSGARFFLARLLFRASLRAGPWGRHVRRAAAWIVFLTGCSVDLGEHTPLAVSCGLTPYPGVSHASPTACRVLRATRGARVSTEPDGCRGSTCLVVQPGQRYYAWETFDSSGTEVWGHDDPSCTEACP